MCSVSKAAINWICYWINEGIDGKATEIKVDPEEDESIADGFKGAGSAFGDMDSEQIN